MKNGFYLKHKQKKEYNQYWYSPKTVQFLVKQAIDTPGNLCFLSCPSVFCSIKGQEEICRSYLFDLDQSFGKVKKYANNFYAYDFKKFDQIPQKYHNFFDFVLIDPPFITKEVWQAFSQTVNIICKKGAKIICSTIDQNEQLLNKLLNVKKITYRPLIPNLVYQYSFFSNYKNPQFQLVNQQIGF